MTDKEALEKIGEAIGAIPDEPASSRDDLWAVMDEIWNLVDNQEAVTDKAKLGMR